MNSPIPWMGSKRRLAKQILKMMPEHKCYVEPFAGGASILFMRDDPAKVEVLNDINGELVNFFRVVKHHLVEFCSQFRYSIISRQIFDWLKMTPPEILTDIQRAARFYYLQKMCFGGITYNQRYGTATTAKPKLNHANLEDSITELHYRLTHVNIENLDWHKCIERYDRKHTLFFIDPPYYKVYGYGAEFELDQYEKLADLMATMKGKAILTINDHKAIRKIFRPFKYQSVDINYMVGGQNKAQKAKELIYRNF